MAKRIYPKEVIKMTKSWKALEDENLTSTQKLVYTCLCKYQGNNDFCFPSHKTIAKKCGIGVTTVKRSIIALIQHGYIGKEHRFRPNGGQTSNIYICLK